MAKPILVINYCIEGMPMRLAVRNLRELQAVVSESNANDEYFVFLLPVTADSNVQVFYDKDLDEIHYEELKNMIETKIKSFEEAKQDLCEADLEDDTIWEDETRWDKIKQFFSKIF